MLRPRYATDPEGAPRSSNRGKFRTIFFVPPPLDRRTPPKHAATYDAWLYARLAHLLQKAADKSKDRGGRPREGIEGRSGPTCRFRPKGA